MATEFETWAPVIGYEGKYEVSNVGRIRGLARQDSLGRTWPAKLMRLPINMRGYRKVTLSRDGKQNVREVHQLVCEAFHGRRPAGAEVRHLDGDSLNNCAWNLAWGTTAENAQDALKHGQHHHARKTRCSRGHELVIANLSQNLTSARRCRACYNARAFVRRYPDADFQAEADKRYAAIRGWSQSH